MNQDTRHSKQVKTFKTPKGTELPILDLRGKDYLQVAYRIVWFREEHPDWTITTEYLKINDDQAVARATISDSSGKVISMGTKSEDKKGFGDFIEKSETGAIGRALAHCGFGTQFAPDLDEHERLADSPVHRPAPTDNAVRSQNKATSPFGSGGDSRGITEPQAKRLFAIAMQNGWTKERLKEYLGDMGLEHTKDLSRYQYDSLIAKIEAHPFPKESGFDETTTGQII